MQDGYCTHINTVNVISLVKNRFGDIPAQQQPRGV